MIQRVRRMAVLATLTWRRARATPRPATLPSHLDYTRNDRRRPPGSGFGAGSPALIGVNSSLISIDSKGTREPIDYLYGRVFQPPLNPSDMRPIDLRIDREVLLR
jgi:hypothetical protein